MKRLLLITLLIVCMLPIVGFTSAGASYWQDMKQIYEWNAMEGESEAELNLLIPDMDIDYQFKVSVSSKSSFDDFGSYSEIKIEDVKEKLNIPIIKMYTSGSDIYINKEAVLALLSAAGVADGVEIEEEYVMLESEQDGVDIDFKNLLNDLLEFIGKMDLGVDLDMGKEGNTYTLTVESDELIDLLDAYIRYIIENIDELPNSLLQGQEIVLTEAEKQEALEEYSAFVSQYKDIAKMFIKGSKFYMQCTFEEDKYIENSQLDIKTPVGSLNMNTVSTTSKLETSDIELPTSVMVITAGELGELIASKIVRETMPDVGLKAAVKLDGTYVKIGESGLEEGQISLENIDGRVYIAVKDAEKLLGVKLEGLEDPFHVRELDEYGFRVDWNEENRVIEFY
ncbi:MAG TPA: hypothetical protein VFF25_01580 [Clostridia bacterium]|nr:hypothetical protein [Clostridia bacterium]